MDRIFRHFGLIPVGIALLSTPLWAAPFCPELFQNTGIAGVATSFVEGKLPIRVSESGQGADLNGDGDLVDTVIHIFDPSSHTLMNTGMVQRRGGPPHVPFDGTHVASLSPEELQGKDLNGDGDLADSAIQLFDLATATRTSIPLAVERLCNNAQPVSRRTLFADRVAFLASEEGQGEDLNGDGDQEDLVPHIAELPKGTLTNIGLPVSGWNCFFDGQRLAFSVNEDDLFTDVNGDGDQADAILLIYDLDIGEFRRPGIAGTVSGLSSSYLAFTVPEADQGEDLNGDGDFKDLVPHGFDLATGAVFNTKVAKILPGGFIWGPFALGPSLVGSRFVFLAGGAENGGSLPVTADHSPPPLRDDIAYHIADFATGTVTNVGVTAGPVFPRSVSFGPLILVFAFDGEHLAFPVDECAEGEDLNENGFFGPPIGCETVVHVFHVATQEVTNLGRGMVNSPGFFFTNNHIAFVSYEGGGGEFEDLNGDADLRDFVPQVYDAASDSLINVGVSTDAWLLETDGAYVVANVLEGGEGVDFNADGDLDDVMLHLMHLHRQELVNLQINYGGASLSEGFAIVHLREERNGLDLNSNGDQKDLVPLLFDLALLEWLEGTAADGFALMRAKIAGLAVPRGLRTSLLAKVTAAEEAASSQDRRRFDSLMAAFTQHIEALEGSVLMEADANPLLAGAKALPCLLAESP